MPDDEADELMESYDFLEDAFSELLLGEGDGCPSCGGTGEAPDNGTNMGECEDCNGTGELDCNY